MIRVDITVEHEPFPVDVERLRAAVLRIVKDAGKSKGSVSVAVVDDATIHDVNLRFLQHDEPTDVVSFALEDEGKLLEGEIVLGADVAARSAAELKIPPDDELLLYAIHGALHIVGHDDLTPEPRKTMRAREREYLAAFGVSLPSPPEELQ
ncbi:MAG: rRNA maturation RNase YbeY [Planctomycetales bacterium]|nr:rRNA maturation RNase YbeY [Planctomycetales bacterium]MBN8624416.1 rRNA maturation RNase YbeY [Planctomycetota bacterium]